MYFSQTFPEAALTCAGPKPTSQAARGPHCGRSGVTRRQLLPASSSAAWSAAPTRTFQSNGRYCREFQQEITVGGQRQQGFGTACRQPDGAWQIVG